MSVRNYPDNPRVYLDMDGVVADFERAMNEHKLSASQLKVIPNAYRTLRPMPGAIEGVHKIIEFGFFVMVLTKIPSENPFAATEKILWLQEHLPILEDHIIITPDKGCVGDKGDFLVDDHPEWANAHKFPGSIIKLGGTYDLKNADGHAADWEILVDIFKNHSENQYAGMTRCQ